MMAVSDNGLGGNSQNRIWPRVSIQSSESFATQLDVVADFCI